MSWQAGVARCVITPQNDVWLAGYGSKRVAEGTIHDLWAKAPALQAPDGKRAALAMGSGRCTFAVNRRENTEEEVPRMRAAGLPLRGWITTCRC